MQLTVSKLRNQNLYNGPHPLVRAHFTADTQWEIVRDFFIGMQLYASFDGEPSVSDGTEIDYGYRTTIGLKF